MKSRSRNPMGSAPGMVVALLLCGVLVVGHPVWGQQTQPAARTGTLARQEGRFFRSLFDYLNMTSAKSAEFRPLTQSERNRLFGKSLINPLWYLRAALSAGQNQWKDIPQEWEQGVSGYGKRYADIMGQYSIRKTVTYGLESAFHEDNRYFASGQKSFWPRTGYALKSSLMARHDNGKRYPSASLLVGYASGAYLSRFWQPPSTRSVGDAAVSFGISMGWNIGFSVLKEFLPDMLRPLTGKGKATKTPPPHDGTGSHE